MRLSGLNVIPQSMNEINVFGGINDNVYTPEGFFKQMENMSSDYYPALAPRKIRDKYKVNNRINGVVTVNGNVYMAVGTGLYKNGTIINGVVLENNSKKMLVLGAEIVIIPDKIVYNTEDNTSVMLDLTIKINQRIGYSSSDSVRSPWGFSNCYLAPSDELGNPYLDCSMQIHTEGYIDYVNKTAPVGSSKVNPYVCSRDDVKNYNKDEKYTPMFLSWNKLTDNVCMQQYFKESSAFMPVDMYTTLYAECSSSDDAQKVFQSIKQGDCIEFNIEDRSGKVRQKNDFMETEWNLINQLIKGVYVKKVNYTGKYILIVLRGVDILNFMKKNNYMSEGTAFGEAAVYNVPATVRFPFSSDESLIIKREIPDMDFMTVSNNRIWGCSSNKHEIYACKQGDAKNWNTFAGLASDAYAVTVGSDGDFTGACTYRGEPYFFKEDLIICMYGNKPSNYQVSEIFYPGIEKGSSESICYLGGVMYYKSRRGIVRFDGSGVYPVSDELGNRVLKNAKAIAGDKKYFVSVKDGEKSSLYVYDSDKGLWHMEDNLNPDGLFKAGNGVFAYTIFPAGSYIYRLDGNAELPVQGVILEKTAEVPENIENGDYKINTRGIRWSAATGPIESGSIEAKYIQRIGIRYEAEDMAVLKVLVQYDNETAWSEVFYYEGKKNEGAVSIAFRPRRCEKFRLKFEGEGQCLIHRINRSVNEGSDMHYGNF